MKRGIKEISERVLERVNFFCNKLNFRASMQNFESYHKPPHNKRQNQTKNFVEFTA